MGVDPQHMTGLQRFKATCVLWPYMVPLFVVYFAEVRGKVQGMSAYTCIVVSGAALKLSELECLWPIELVAANADDVKTMISQAH